MYKALYNINEQNLIKIRSHLGHNTGKLNNKINPYLYGTRHNINIYDIKKLWTSYRYLFYNFSEMFLKRNTFFIVGTNKRIPVNLLLKNWLAQDPFINKKNNKFYVSGYVDKKWIGGLFSNWKIFYEFIKYIPMFNKGIKIKYKFEKYMSNLQGAVNLQKMPIPDFIIMLDKDKIALDEIKNLQVPLIGIIDTDMDPDDFVYKFLGNNDSIEYLDFVFSFISEAIKEGRLKEQQLFYIYVISKIKRKLNG